MQLNSLGLQNTALDGVLLIQGQRQTDARGTTHSLFDAPHFAAFGLSTRFVADHFTRANQGSLYGLYYARDAHKGMEMAQLFTAIRGSVFVVAVDLRARRPTFGQAIGFTLNDTMPQAYLAPGIAWGYAVTSETADIHQKFTALPVAHQMGGIVWNDPELQIQWPFQRPVVSSEDAQFPSLEKAMLQLARPREHEVVIR